MVSLVKSTGEGVGKYTLRTLWAASLLILAACAGQAPVVDMADDTVPPDYRILSGWASDTHHEALPALRRSCRYLVSQSVDKPVGQGGVAGRVADWRAPCDAVKTVPEGQPLVARRFFETWFTPVSLGGGGEGLFTGYFEGELRGSWHRGGAYTVPIYRAPSRRAGQALPVRAQIARGALAGRGLELLWVDDAVDAFIMEIQGSGRVKMEDGSVVALNYAAQNGHKYFAIGKALVDRGVTTYEKLTMPVIRDWLHSHPDEAQSVMNLNPSYVFFRLRNGVDPRGSVAELTAGRSLAVDPSFVPMGVPIWLDLKEAPVPGGVLRRLVLAQDTGGAIKGEVRGDLFWGHGETAANNAGVMKAKGRFFALVPRQSGRTGGS